MKNMFLQNQLVQWHLALGAFGGANIAVYRGEGYAESVDPILMLQPTIGVNINFIPTNFIRFSPG